jgi:hypothetical protein
MQQVERPPVFRVAAPVTTLALVLVMQPSPVVALALPQLHDSRRTAVIWLKYM